MTQDQAKLRVNEFNKTSATRIDKIYYVEDIKVSITFQRKRKIGDQRTKKIKSIYYYSQTVDDIYEYLEDYNPMKKRKVLVVTQDMIEDMEAYKTLRPIVLELFLRERKLNISLAFISTFYFKVPKTIRLNATYYFILNIPTKR